MGRMKENLSPLFTDMTWGAGGSTADLSMKLALRAHETGHVGKNCLSFTFFINSCDMIFSTNETIHDSHNLLILTNQQS